MSDLLFCKICQIECLSKEQLILHEADSRHQVRLMQEQAGVREKSKSGLKFELKSFDSHPASFQPIKPDVERNEIQLSAMNNMSKVKTHIRNSNAEAYGMGELNEPSNSPQYQFITGRENSLNSFKDSVGVGVRSGSPLKDQEYFFDRMTQKGKCYICNVDFTSFQHAQDHLNGKIHRHKKVSFEKELKNPQMTAIASPDTSVCSNDGSQGAFRSSPMTDGSDSNILMCFVCQAPFSSPFNMEQHFAGKKHKKEMMKRELMKSSPNNEEMQRKEQNSQSDDGLNILSPSVKMMSSRNESERELNSRNFSGCQHEVNPPVYESGMSEQKPVKFERSVSENMPANNDKVTPLKDKVMIGPYQSSNTPTTVPEPFVSSTFSSIVDNRQQPTSSILNNHEELGYRFDGEKGTCFACSVEITSKKFALQHLNGQPHKKKLQQWKDMKMHQTHTKRLEVDNIHRNLSYQEMTSPSNLRDPQNFYDIEFAHFDGNKGFCKACNSEITSPIQASQHFEGKPHKRNVERCRMSKYGMCYPLKCEVCQKEFTGQQSATDHFVSEKHKRNESLLSSDTARLLETFENGRKLSKDGQIWFFCDVCRKVLNTLEQLNIHNRSPQHLAGLEKGRANMGISPHGFYDEYSQNNEMFETPGKENSSRMPQYGTPSPQFGQNSNRSSIDMQDTMEKINELLVFGQTPVVNVDFSTSRSTMTDSANGASFAGQSESIDLKESNWSPESNRGFFGSQAGPKGLDVMSNKSPNDVQRNGNGYHLGNVQDQTGGGVRRSNSNTYNSTSPAERTNVKHETEHREELERSPQLTEGLSAFGNVTTGVKRPSNRGSRQDKGQRCQLSLNPADDDDEESSSDENEDDDSRMNISEAQTPYSGEKSVPAPTTSGSLVPKNKYYCDLCKKQMNAKKSYRDHLEGKMHQWNLSCEKAPSRGQDSVIESSWQDEDVHKIFKMTKNTPRSYQVKLTQKAMSSDCVVYLPTGTGKTMVSVLTIGLMLEKNPKRPVIFLVDKVLLVIQQALYIEKEFEDKVFLRASVNLNGTEDLVERKLNLGFVCRGLLRNNNLPIYQNDIIVTTADYCINMLNNGSILWEDFSLAILDEVHHCIKKHPYQKLIKNYHKRLDPTNRPKILGLTASPAGKSSVEATYEMLQCLLQGLGGAKIAFVDKDNERELKTYQSNPQLCQFCVPLTQKEKDFQVQCIKYFLRCYIRLAPMCTTLRNNYDPPCSYFIPVLNDTSEDNLTKMTHGFMTDAVPLSEIFNEILNGQCFSKMNEDDKSKFDSLRMHTLSILFNINDIPLGVDFEELKKNFNKEFILEDVKALGLPCDTFYKQILNFEEEEGSVEPPMVGKLMQILEDPDFVDWRKEDSMALVLVRERKTAKSLSKKLRHKPFIKNKVLRVTHLVGHGKKSQDGGMAVKEQKKVLDNQGKYHILVATSIAEEGVDLKTLGLVVCMNPPSNVTALVQMRGRARKKGSYFVILCSSEEEMKKLEDLQQQEENMMKAAMMCNQ